MLFTGYVAPVTMNHVHSLDCSGESQGIHAVRINNGVT